MSKLLTQTQLAEIPDLYTQENVADPICYIKLFTPDSSWSWYIIELSQDNKDLCFGYVQGLEDELGYFALSELELVKGNLGLGVEVDTSFTPSKLSVVKGAVQ